MLNSAEDFGFDFYHHLHRKEDVHVLSAMGNKFKVFLQTALSVEAQMGDKFLLGGWIRDLDLCGSGFWFSSRHLTSALAPGVCIGNLERS